MNAVEADSVDVTNWYLVACEAVVRFSSTTDRFSDKRTFLKCLSVVTKPKGHENNETHSLFGSTFDDEIQQTGIRSEIADDIASRHAGETLINMSKDTSNLIDDGG